MKENNLVLDMEARHMDNIRVFLACLRADWKWHNWSLAFCHEWEQEDRSGRESMSRKTGEQLRRGMNQVFSLLNFTIELEENVPEGYLPTLDVKVLDTGRATYKYF